MWDFFSTVINKVSPATVQILLIVVVAAAIYIVPRLRRDKQGRWYIFSKQYEANKNQRKDEMSRMCADIKALERRLDDGEKCRNEARDEAGKDRKKIEDEIVDIRATAKRTEFMLYVADHPDQPEVIERLYREYKSLPEPYNDHYVDDIHAAWYEKHGKEIIAARV